MLLNQFISLLFSSSVMRCLGKPVNLSSNCYKHVLAELKHFHVKGLHAGDAGDGTTLPQIPPPPWTPAVLNQGPPSSAGDRLELEDGNSNESESGNDSPGGRFGLLSAIDREIDHVSSAVKSSTGTSDVADYIEAVETLCQEKQQESQSLDRPCKKPRGNSGFFKHIRDQQALVPRGVDEPYDVYAARLREIARATWHQNDTQQNYRGYRQIIDGHWTIVFLQPLIC